MTESDANPDVSERSLTEQSNIARWIPAGFVKPIFFISLVLHLPHLLKFFDTRFRDPVWFFVPLAWIAAPVLLRRMRRNHRSLDNVDAALFIGVLFLLAAAYALNSPWTGCVAAVVLFAILFRRFTNSDDTIRLTRLSLLLALTAGLPPSISADIWQTGVDAAKDAVSACATRFGIWHAQTPESFITETGSFAVSDAFGNPIGLFLIFLFSLTFGMMARRSWIHLLLSTPGVLSLGLAQAVLTGILILATGTQYGFWTSLIPCSLISLILILPLVVSLDSLVYWFTEVVVGEDIVSRSSTDSSGRDSANGLRLLWNRWVSADPASHRIPLTFQADNGLRIPLTRQFNALISDWWNSRDLLRLLAGSPAAVVLLTIVPIAYSLGSWREQAIADYRRLLAEAKAAKNPEATNMAHQMLSNLAPDDVVHTLEYADYLLEDKQHGLAVDLLQPLLLNGRYGVADAHLWLVEKHDAGLLSSTDLPQSRMGHLVAASKAAPRDAGILKLLARAQEQAGEISLAALSHRKLSQLDPELLVERFEFEFRQNRLDRSSLEFKSCLQSLTEKFESDSANSDAAMKLSKALIFDNRWQDALDVLRKAVAANSNEQVSMQLAANLSLTIELAMSPGVYDPAQLKMMALEALSLDPKAPGLVRAFSEFSSNGHRFSVDDMQRLLDAHELPQDASDSTAVMQHYCADLVFSLSSGLEHTVIKSLPAHDLARIYLNLLWQTDEGDDSSLRLGNELLTELENSTELDPADEFRMRLNVLIETRQFDLAMDLVKSTAASVDAMDSLTRSRMLQNIVFRRFDSFISPQEKLAAGSRWLPRITDPETSNSLLKDFLEISSDQAAYAALAERLTRMLIAGGPGCEEASALLNRLATSDSALGRVPRIVGAVALQCEAWDLARLWLTRAYRVRESANDYALLNNLAILNVRDPQGDTGDVEKAFELISAAAKLRPKHPSILATRGEIHLRRGNCRLAVLDLQQSAEIDTQNLENLVLLESALRKCGRNSEAFEIRRRIERIDTAKQ